MTKEEMLGEVARDLRSLAIKMDLEGGWVRSDDVHKYIVRVADIRAGLSNLEYQLRKQEQEKVKP